MFWSESGLVLVGAGGFWSGSGLVLVGSGGFWPGSGLVLAQITRITKDSSRGRSGRAAGEAPAGHPCGDSNERTPLMDH